MADTLPPGFKAYRRTPVFTEATIPAGLRRQHSTKPGVWALITVLEGRLRLRRLAGGGETDLEPSAPGVIEPEELHEVEPLGAVRFFVEFYAATSQHEA